MGVSSTHHSLYTPLALPPYPNCCPAPAPLEVCLSFKAGTEATSLAQPDGLSAP